MFIGGWRNYQRPLIIFVFSGIIFTFVFWGMGDPGTLVDGLLGRDPRAGVTLGSVGGEPITAEEFGRAIERVRQQQAMGQEPPSNQELWETGAVWAAWDDLVNAKLIEVFANRDGHAYERPFLVEQMKSMPDFQRADGTFDARAWNEWVTNRNVDWARWYDEQSRMTNRQVFAERALASARVLESELKRRFELENTEITVRYTALEPNIEPTEDDLRGLFDENPRRYAAPQQWRAAFIRVPVEPDITQDLEAIENLAASGESFESLAEIYSGQPLNATFAEIGWVELNDNLPALREPLRDLAVGETSAAVRSGTAYLVYKVVEERFEDAAEETPADAEGDDTNADEGADEEATASAPIRSVRVEQLTLRPQLAPEEREAIVAQAESLLERAAEEGGLEAIAEAEGLVVFTSDLFDATAAEINGVSQADVFAFRNAFQPRFEEGEITDLVRGVSNLYIAQVLDKPERAPRAFEEVREEVAADFTREFQASEAFRQQVVALGSEVRDTVDSLSAIPEAFPNLMVNIDQLGPFSVSTFSFASGLRWNVREVVQAARDLEPGEMAGPFSDFIGRSVYFIELVDRADPSEEAWEERWPEEREQMLEMANNMAMNQQFEDYLLFLRDRAIDELDVRRNDALILQYLGLSQPGGPPVEAAAVETS